MSFEADAGAAAPANDAALTPAVADNSVTQGNVAETPAVETTTKTPSMDETMLATWDKLHPKRDVAGRFAASDAQAVEAEVSTAAETETKESADQTAEQATGTETPSTEPPHSWSAEAKALWAQVPPAAQAIIAKRETEAHQAITRAGEQIKAFEPIRNVVEQFSETFQRNGLPPHEGIARMLAVNNWLDKDAGAAIREIAKAYGVDLKGLNGEQAAAAAEGTQGEQEPAYVSTLKRELAETKEVLNRVTSHLTEQQRSQLQSEQSALARQIADFAKDKPHFETVRTHMAGLMQTGAAQTLDDAYDMAVHAHPDIRKRIQEDQRKADEEKRAEEARKKATEAKKSAAVNVRSSAGAGTTPRTIDDTLSDIARKHYS